MQPHCASWDLLAELVSGQSGEENASLHTWRQTLQIWMPRGDDPKTLLGLGPAVCQKVTPAYCRYMIASMMQPWLDGMNNFEKVERNILSTGASASHSRPHNCAESFL